MVQEATRKHRWVFNRAVSRLQHGGCVFGAAFPVPCRKTNWDLVEIVHIRGVDNREEETDLENVWEGDTLRRTWWPIKVGKAGKGCLVWTERSVLNWDRTSKRRKERSRVRVSLVRYRQTKTSCRPFMCQCFWPNILKWSDYGLLSLCLQSWPPRLELWERSGWKPRWRGSHGRMRSHRGRERTSRRAVTHRKRMFTPWGEHLRKEWPVASQCHVALPGAPWNDTWMQSCCFVSASVLGKSFPLYALNFNKKTFNDCAEIISIHHLTSFAQKKGPEGWAGCEWGVEGRLDRSRNLWKEGWGRGAGDVVCLLSLHPTQLWGIALTSKLSWQ